MSILIVGGAGYIGSQTAKCVAQAGLDARGVRQPRLRTQVGGQVGPARRGRSRRRRADQARAGGARGDRGRALRRLRLRGRVGDQPAQVLPQQRGRNDQPARRDDRRGRARHRVLVDVRDVRRAAAGADLGGPSPEPGQPVRRDQAGRREDAALVRAGVRPAVRGAALLQRRRRRSRRRGRRGPRSGDAPHPAGDRGGHGRQVRQGPGDLRHRLRDARRNGDPRLHPRAGSGRRARRGAGQAAGRRRQPARQPRHGPRALGAGGDRGRGEGERQEDRGARDRPARRRSTGAGRRRAARRRRPGLEGAHSQHRDHRRARLALDAEAEARAHDRSEAAGPAGELGTAVASAARGVGDRGGAPTAAAVDGRRR